MQQYDFQAAAGKTFPIAGPGRYLKYLSGNNGGGDVSIVVTPNGQGATKIVLVPGQAVRLPLTSVEPAGWILSNNAGGATIAGSVVIGNGEIDDPTINGTVQVIDGGKARTIAGNAFVMYGQQLAVAGNYGLVQLWNPAASGVRLIVEAFEMTTAGAAASAFLVFNNTQQATLVGSGVSKRSSLGAIAKGTIYTGTTVSQPAAGSDLFSFSLASASNGPYKFNEPLCVDPGWGLVVWGAGQNVQFGAAFEWFEEPNV